MVSAAAAGRFCRRTGRYRGAALRRLRRGHRPARPRRPLLLPARLRQAADPTRRLDRLRPLHPELGCLQSGGFRLRLRAAERRGGTMSAPNASRLLYLHFWSPTEAEVTRRIDEAVAKLTADTNVVYGIVQTSCTTAVLDASPQRG